MHFLNFFPNIPISGIAIVYKNAKAHSIAYTAEWNPELMLPVFDKPFPKHLPHIAYNNEGVLVKLVDDLL